MPRFQRSWRSLQLHLVEGQKLVYPWHYKSLRDIIIFFRLFVERYLFVHIISNIIFCGPEGLESRLKNRVVRWAAGYNVVRVRQSDRRFKFSQYPDSKISDATKYPPFSDYLGTRLTNAYHTTMFAFSSCTRPPPPFVSLVVIVTSAKHEGTIVRKAHCSSNDYEKYPNCRMK